MQVYSSIQRRREETTVQVLNFRTKIADVSPVDRKGMDWAENGRLRRYWIHKGWAAQKTITVPPEVKDIPKWRGGRGRRPGKIKRMYCARILEGISISNSNGYKIEYSYKRTTQTTLTMVFR